MTWEKPDILGGDPIAGVLLGDDRNVALSKNLIAAAVVQVIVTVDGIENGLSTNNS